MGRKIRRLVWGSSFRPDLELLDDRRVPSVTTTFDNGLLRVLGDAADDTVAIAADGTDVTVEAGGETEEFADVERVEVSMRGGDDEVTLDLAGETGDVVFEIGTGAGDDDVTVTGEAVADLDLTVETGADDDNFDMTIGDLEERAIWR